MGGGIGVDKVGRYTNIGAMEATTEIEPGREMPEPVPDFSLGVYADWELDIWHKLHNAKKQLLTGIWPVLKAKILLSRI
ncbi:hypothetical protein [Niabella ginsengisoli]|uniref:Uncharacterized protein n=1 Tax=Niabella ginsengisoli TaxID=522298 RepID=A0ABS9SR51_9BACT|nr:hypothetical protein [Niabella ginsengisoli]MCH5600847.1 hypothetical protein [Niabella ginsengisoli]